jgi:signal transduction histidine kinase
VSYTVQTGLTLNRTLDILSNFRYQLSLLIGLGLAVSSLAGYFMSRKALTPIAAIAAEAQRINDRNLNSRLPELPSKDELAALSSTLNQMLRRIESGYQSVRSFTANAAHELRTPVALLRAETEVALAFPRDAAYYRATCERVLENSRQMAHLIDQLLTLARADAGVGDLRLEPCDLSDLLTAVADDWSQRFAGAGIELELDLASSELWAEADYIALKRLLNILIENAWRYTPSGESVTLTLAGSGDGATITVADTGLGIAPEDQARVFERFYRAAQPLHGDFAGSGLGLALAQWIARSHGSEVRLESAPGVGSRFALTLATMRTPVADPMAVEEAGEFAGDR